MSAIMSRMAASMPLTLSGSAVLPKGPLKGELRALLTPASPMQAQGLARQNMDLDPNMVAFVLALFETNPKRGAVKKTYN